MKKNRIALGGLVAVLALAAVAMTVFAAGLAVPPVTGSLCGNSGPFDGPNGLRVKKDVFCEKGRSWTWDILKTAAESALTLSTGQTAFVDYDVTVSATPLETNFGVRGNISMINLSDQDILVTTVTDTLGVVDCGGALPAKIAPGNSIVCTYTGTLSSPAVANSATVTDSSAVSVTATTPINWDAAEILSDIDKCVDVTDTLEGSLGTVCADGQTTFHSYYTRQIGPYEACGPFKVMNEASFVTNDTATTGASSWTIDMDVPCEGGCSLTPGYWKTHSSFGPAPYDDTWALLGENTAFFLSGQTYYQVLWTNPRGGNAYYILAHAYIAAKLNQLNGADISAVSTEIGAAEALFAGSTPAQVGSLKGAARHPWTDLASTLDDYNNGLIGPGHCSE